MNKRNDDWILGLAAWVLAALLVAACGDTTVSDDDDDGGPTSSGSSGAGNGSGDFEIFDCAFDYSCEDGTVASVPLETCTTTNVLSVLIVEADTNGVCQDACENMDSGMATSCSLQCEPRGASCSCPPGVDECFP